MIDHKTELTNLNEYFCRQKCRKRLNFLSNLISERNLNWNIKTHLF